MFSDSRAALFYQAWRVSFVDNQDGRDINSVRQRQRFVERCYLFTLLDDFACGLLIQGYNSVLRCSVLQSVNIFRLTGDYNGR